MSIPPYGSDALLRFQLRHRIRTLKEDDQRILWEGIDSLTKMELREACQERGMRSVGLSKDSYKRALQQWLDLSVNKNVPISLLVMSRTFFLHEEMALSKDIDGSKSVASLADAISGLDRDVVNEVVLEVATPEEVQKDPSIRQIKLEVLEAQNERIHEEQMERLAATKKKEEKQGKEKEEKEKEKEEVLQEAPEVQSVAMDAIQEPTTVSKTTTTTTTEVPFVWKATAAPAMDVPIMDLSAMQEGGKPAEEEESEEEGPEDLSSQEMDAISQLLSPDPVNAEREQLERIKEALKTHEAEAKAVAATAPTDSLGESEKATIGTTLEEPSPEAPIDAKVADKIAAEQIAQMVDAAEKSSTETTTIDLETTKETTAEPDKEEEEEEGSSTAAEEEASLKSTMDRLKTRVSRMLEKIETQLDDVQIKIGDKLHALDKDNDGIISSEEVAHCLQHMLKRDLTSEEAMEIAALMVSTVVTAFGQVPRATPTLGEHHGMMSQSRLFVVWPLFSPDNRMRIQMGS